MNGAVTSGVHTAAVTVDAVGKTSFGFLVCYRTGRARSGMSGATVRSAGTRAHRPSAYQAPVKPESAPPPGRFAAMAAGTRGVSWALRLL